MIESPGNSSKVKKFYHFSYLMTLRYRRYVTYGIRARVETLRPNWDPNAPTHFVLEIHVH